MGTVNKALNIICGIIVIVAVGFTIAAIGSGKIGEIFGEEFFITSADDMKVAFGLQFLAAFAIVYLLVSLYLRGQKLNDVTERVNEWEQWRKDNVGKIIS